MLKNYLTLLKLRVVELLIVTTIPAMFLAAKGFPDLKIALATVIGGTLAAGSANAFNMAIEVDRDRLMTRTASRPTAQNLISKKSSYIFAAVVGIISLAIFQIFTNKLATLLTLFAIVFYVIGYTIILKPNTSQNIVWGGIAGCMPVLIGWAAIENKISLTAILFFLIIFVWTPPHFWALALYRRDDYVQSGLPMLPVTHGERFTLLNIVLYTLILIAATMLPYIYGMSGLVYLISAILLGLVFLAYTIALFISYSDALAKKTFRFSITYLSLLFAALLIDHYFL